MKKIIWLFLSLPLLIWSQEEATPVSKGKIYLNAATTGEWGNILVPNGGRALFGNSYYYLQIGGGYALADNWVLGVNFHYTNIDYTISSFSPMYGVFMRYYFPYHHVLFFLHGDVSYGSSKWELDYEYDPNMGISRIHYLDYNLMGGLAVPLGRYIHLDIMAGYENSSARAPDTEIVTYGWGLNLGFSIFLDVSKK